MSEHATWRDSRLHCICGEWDEGTNAPQTFEEHVAECGQAVA